VTIIEKLKEYWEVRPAKQKRIITWALIGGGLFIFLYIFVSSGSDPVERRPSDREVKGREVFVGAARLDQHGQQYLKAELEDLRKSQNELGTLVDRINRRLASEEVRTNEHLLSMLETFQRRIERNVSSLSEQMGDMQDAIDLLEKEGRLQEGGEGQEESSGQAVLVPSRTRTVPDARDKAGDVSEPEHSLWTPSLSPVSSTKAPRSIPADDESEVKAVPVLNIRTIEQKVEDSEDDEALVETEDSEKFSFFVPAGTILSGTLITGMDAPTGDYARGHPYPVLMRIKKEAILPNRFRADIRECFLIASGYGDLSSERANIRSERISCIREDGNPIETRIEMYAVGEDGKLGVRGRLVSKQGQILARALMAGFMEGATSMFGKSPVPTISLRDTSSTPYQRALTGDSVEAASLHGAGKAMDRLAQFYIDMAKNMFPIIEIDAGRNVDFVAIRGVDFNTRQTPAADQHALSMKLEQLNQN
jgi:conjugal transfer pilus assembly protein TraB